MARQALLRMLLLLFCISPRVWGPYLVVHRAFSWLGAQGSLLAAYVEPLVLSYPSAPHLVLFTHSRSNLLAFVRAPVWLNWIPLDLIPFSTFAEVLAALRQCSQQVCFCAQDSFSNLSFPWAAHHPLHLDTHEKNHHPLLISVVPGGSSWPILE